MKKFTLLLLLLGLTILTYTQIVILEDELVITGDIVVEAYDEMPDSLLIPGLPGPDKVWDFTMLTENYSDTTWFINPDWTPYDEYFPDANFAMIAIEDSSYIFFERTPLKFSAVGTVYEIDTFGIIPMPVIPEEIITDLPMLYGNADTGFFYQEFKAAVPVIFVDSMKYKIATTKTSVIDAWGTMSIPSGTYNVLRMHVIREEVDSVWIKFPIFGWRYIDSLRVNRIIEHYTWWSNDIGTGTIIVDMLMNELSGDVEGISYLKEAPFQDIEENNPATNIRVFPNPASTEVCFEFPGSFEGILRISNASSKLITDKNIKDENPVCISLKDNATGFYVYHIRDKNNKRLKSGKIIKK